VNFRFCVLKDELAWRVRDSDIECVCPWGRKESKAQNNLLQARLVSSLVISNVAAVHTRGDGKSRACNSKAIHTRAPVTVTSTQSTRFTCNINHIMETVPMGILFLHHSAM
jgi:hypothetical protein